MYFLYPSLLLFSYFILSSHTLVLNSISIPFFLQSISVPSYPLGYMSRCYLKALIQTLTVGAFRVPSVAANANSENSSHQHHNLDLAFQFPCLTPYQTNVLHRSRLHQRHNQRTHLILGSQKSHHAPLYCISEKLWPPKRGCCRALLPKHNMVSCCHVGRQSRSRYCIGS